MRVEMEFEGDLFVVEEEVVVDRIWKVGNGEVAAP